MILVTGGCGYIGSHTVVALLEQGHDVIILDNLSYSKKSVLTKIHDITGKSATFVSGDIGDPEVLEHIFQTYQIDQVIHFAAYKSVGDSCKDPFAYYDNNITSTLTLLTYMQKYDISRIVFSSSCTVYDTTASGAPFTESQPIGNTTNPYGTSKLIVEHILRDLCRRKGLQCTILRYFNPIGAHSSGLIGEDPNGTPTNLLPLVFQSIYDDSFVLKVFGVDYDTPDGSCIRDYIHVVDLASAHIAALVHLGDHPLSGSAEPYIYNIGTGTGTSVLEVIHTAQQITGRTVKHQIVGKRDGDIPVAYADTSHTTAQLGRSSSLTVADAIRDSERFYEMQSGQ